MYRAILLLLKSFRIFFSLDRCYVFPSLFYVFFGSIFVFFFANFAAAAAAFILTQCVLAYLYV